MTSGGEHPLKLVVLVKHVPDEAADRLFTAGVFAADLTVDRDGLSCRLSEPDEYAVEQAMRIARRRMDVQICVVTMGPAGAVRTLARALALGADEAVHVLDDALHGSDAQATSRVLAAAVERLGFDLVLCGTASTDSGMSVVPAMVAERLGVPAACEADTVWVGEDEVMVRRDEGTAVVDVAVGMPAVVSVTDRIGEPRYPAFRSIVEARQKTLRTWSLKDLRIPAAEVGLGASATVVRSVTPCAEQRPALLVEGEARGAAARLAAYLTEHQLI
ncbi:electron transfer flavoprotein subunit beta/FixA family protein [Yinghuangia seranimata]|uniref:electron transfer flavoprotein subunit beta/FixA family protein n=1 Tax=Yinghuangia seranimata TaxID=408067 RepID=UPI00248C0435|nr:electron transfer flavoprotein subunit beta/FixA family protein [Yinghuangia seranimata]MDI2130915.1 electron transfer flavoprotein subunit beta/FixA family protein [Yinghuangia seranimata]